MFQLGRRNIRVAEGQVGDVRGHCPARGALKDCCGFMRQHDQEKCSLTHYNISLIEIVTRQRNKYTHTHKTIKLWVINGVAETGSNRTLQGRFTNYKTRMDSHSTVFVGSPPTDILFQIRQYIYIYIYIYCIHIIYIYIYIYNICIQYIYIFIYIYIYIYR